jgi:hypothetical protein
MDAYYFRADLGTGDVKGVNDMGYTSNTNEGGSPRLHQLLNHCVVDSHFCERVLKQPAKVVAHADYADLPADERAAILDAHANSLKGLVAHLVQRGILPPP